MKPLTKNLLLTLASVSLVLSQIACRSTDDQSQRRVVTANDFLAADTGMPSHGQDATRTDRQPSVDTPAEQDTKPPVQPDIVVLNPSVNNASTDGSDGNGATTVALTLDAMVGQVNGRAIYANTVFEPIKEQLAALGRTLPPSVFKQRATEQIFGELQTLITNALILGESERDLSSQERMGLLAMLQTRREEILRQFGEGSQAVADKHSFERTGKNVDEQVKDFREKVLMDRYFGEKIRNKVNVTRRDIERYYDSHRLDYNPPPGRTLRIIMTSSAADADQLEKLLASGKSFDEVASNSANQYRSSSGGLMADRIEGDKFSSFSELNDAMIKLKAGEHSPRIAAGNNFWWIKVETYDSGKGRSLDEVQLEIRQILENQQRNVLGMEFRKKLLDEGSYNSIVQMTDKLVEIAMARYSFPPTK